MKSLILVISIFVSNITLADTNPLMRTCRVNGGLFCALNITEPASDQVGFCKYGEAMIGAISFFDLVNQGVDSIALGAFKYTQYTSVEACSFLGAESIIGTDSFGHESKICLFIDYSFIKESTLVNGWNSESNKALKNIILKYSSEL